MKPVTETTLPQGGGTAAADRCTAGSRFSFPVCGGKKRDKDDNPGFPGVPLGPVSLRIILIALYAHPPAKVNGSRPGISGGEDAASYWSRGYSCSM